MAGAVTLSMEEYLATDAFNDALNTAYREARNKYGSHDSNIPAVVLRYTCSRMLSSSSLPAPLGEIPEPNDEFVGKAMASVLPDMASLGVRSLDELELAVQVILLQLAAATDRLGMIAAQNTQDDHSDTDSED